MSSQLSEFLTQATGLPAADENPFAPDESMAGELPPKDAAPAEPFKMTDLGNSELFIAQHGDKIRFCTAWKKWLVWDGCRWNADATSEIHELAKKTVRSIYKQADKINIASAGTKEEKERLFREKERIYKHAMASENVSRIAAMLTLAESSADVAVRADDFDSDPWLLNLKNGIFNLKTGTFSPPDPERLLTRLAPVQYEPSAACPIWEKFLFRVMDGDGEMINFLQRAAGYSLTGSVKEQCLFFLHGTGCNGKSTLAETMARLLGSGYWQKAPPSLIIAKSNEGDGIPNDIARLKGARFVVCCELDEGKRLAESRVKDLTGGDVMTARFLHGEFFDFYPTHKLWIYGNHRPVIRGGDDGIWRRIRLIPFAVQILPSEKDTELGSKLANELPGILNWALEGCRQWQADGLPIPSKVAEATASFREDMDTVGEFLEARTTDNASAWTPFSTLYDTYRKWTEERGEIPAGMKTMANRLADRGFQKDKQAGCRGYRGVQIIGGHYPL